jgi:hypothetical protein
MAKTIMDWKSIIDNGGLSICSAQEAKAKDVYPNRLGWLKEDPKIGAAIVFQSETDFALGKAILEYLVKAKGLKEAFVLLLRRGVNGHLEFVNAATIEEVEALLRNIKPTEGNWGPFWWLEAELGDASNRRHVTWPASKWCGYDQPGAHTFRPRTQVR